MNLMKLKLFDEEVIRQEKVLLITTSFSLDLTTLSSNFPECDKYLNVLNIHSTQTVRKNFTLEASFPKFWLTQIGMYTLQTSRLFKLQIQ